MTFQKNKLLILIFFLLIGCSSIPNNTTNSCSIFNERYLWYKHTKKVEKKMGNTYLYSISNYQNGVRF